MASDQESYMLSDQERLRQVAQFYDSETKMYDDGYSSLTCKAEDAMVAEILGRCLQGKVLDIGAGSGLLCEMMDIDDYVGIELSPRMTEQAKAKYPEQQFMVADMHRLPFSNGSFDSAVSIYGPLSYSLTAPALLSEIQRVVKPGGYIALMPYTLRVGHNLEMGGYSTATEASIPKVFYTAKSLEELLSPLKNVQILGINYFLNTYTRFAQAMGLNDNQSLEIMVDFLQRENALQQILPAEYARHMIGIGQNSFSK